MRRPRPLALAILLALSLAAPALAAFPQDPPNDPNFDRAEENCAEHNVNEEQYYLYSKLSVCAPAATDPEGAAGMSVDRAWREFTPGRPEVLIGYIEGGINWFDEDVKDLVNQVFVNAGELPAPTTPKDDGRLNAADYSDSKDANGNGIVDPEDLIVRFSNGKDEDGNGYTDDISGWDFYEDQNDPATVDSTYDHANNQMRQAAAEADNEFLGAGVCPGCTIVPIKAGAEALDRADELPEAWLYAGDIGVDVIVSVTADLGYSTFMKQAVESLWRKGVVMVEASNDFDSTDHQGGHFHPHVVPGNGLTTNSNGFPGPQANLETTTYRARSGQTSWGTKNFLSVSTQGGSTSTSTPTHGGVYALLLSAGLQFGKPLSNAEVLQVARATASDVSGDTNWPSREGFDLQFGYGRPNVHRAMEAIQKGDIPPVGWIDSPEWYALYDPTRTRAVEVRGHVEARRSSGYSWKLEYAPGAEPSDSDFVAGGGGAGSAPFDGKLGSLDFSKVPESFWTKAFELSKTKTLETNEHYTLTIRLRVTDAEGRVGEERRSIAIQHDPSWVRHFPKKIGPGGEAQAQLIDLQGKGRLAAVFGDADGRVHAVDGVTGRELRGFPVRTRRTRVERPHEGVDPGHEPIINSVAVGDLDRNGRLWVVATSSSGTTYVWSSRGRRRKGWPKALVAGVKKPSIPRQKLRFTRMPHRGATAPPVLVDMNGDHRPEIVQSAWNGRIHVWHANGRAMKGWPLEVTVPESLPPAGGLQRLNDHKLVVPPTVAELDGDATPELVQRSQYFDILDEGIQPGGRGHLHAFNADGSPVSGFPLKMQALVVYYGSAQEFITEGAEVPAAADVDGDGRDEIAAGPIFSPTYLYSGDGSQKLTYGPLPDATLGLLADPRKLQKEGLAADSPVSFTTAAAFGRFGGSLVLAQPGSGAASVAGALLTTGTGLPITNVMRAFSAASGEPVAGFPADLQGLNFLGGPVFADVTGDGKAEVISGADSSALHAFTSGGAQAKAFPKFTTGWTVYAPSVGDLNGDGKVEVVSLTREGYLMAWHTPGDAAANSEWWAFRHDEHNTGRYGPDTRPPGRFRRAKLTRAGLRFTAPGDDWQAGRASSYRVSARVRGARRVRRLTLRPSTAGSSELFRMPRGTRRVGVQALDDAGNRGPRLSLRLRRP